MQLIICEKPSVGQAFAAALGIHGGRHDGYIENNEYIITWCIGHLVEMSYPEVYDQALKKWSISTLPFLPEKYLYEVKAATKKQFNVVKGLLNRQDVSVIYNAGDSGREGEYIQRLVLRQAGYNKNAKFKRIWIDSQTEEEILRGIRTAKDASYYDNLSESAYMRAIEDYAVGINFSRAITCKYGYEFKKASGSTKKRAIAVGRVMTCVLGMVVEREREIKAFKVTPFYKINADTGFLSGWKAVQESHYYNSPLLYNDTGFKEKEMAQKVVAAFSKRPFLKVEKAQRKQEKKNAPLLFNLAELQSECTKRFKISPDETLEIAQALYEAKLTTYPRTDARVLSTAIAKEIEDNLEGLTEGEYRADAAENIINKNWHVNIANTKYCDDSKITDHYAIIPTGKTDVSSLNETQLAVYHLIIDRFISIFYPPAIYEKMEIVLLHQTGERFFTSEKILKTPGYLEIAGKEDTGNISPKLEALKEGEVLSDVKFTVVEGKTVPPKRWTSGDLVIAMENAGNYIDDPELREQIKGCGIGTSSTRAETIKKLKNIQYICIDGKNQIVTPHKDGEIIYDIVKGLIPALLNPKMTASWEKGLEQIANGEISAATYRNKLEDYIRKNVEHIKAQETEEEPEIEGLGIILGTCPFCGGDVVTTSFGMGCTNYKEKKCGFALGNFALDQMGDEQLLKLFEEGETDLIEGMVSKKGKKFSAIFRANMDTKKIEMILPGVAEKEETTLICPKAACKKKNVHLMRSGKWITCDCGFKAYTTLAGRELNDDELAQILAGDTVQLTGFRSSSGTSFDAGVKLKRGGGFTFVFPEGTKKRRKKKF